MLVQEVADLGSARRRRTGVGRLCLGLRLRRVVQVGWIPILQSVIYYPP